MGMKRNAYKVLMRKPEWKKTHSQPGPRWEKNIKLEHKTQPEGPTTGTHSGFLWTSQWTSTSQKHAKLITWTAISALKKGSTPCI